MDTGAVVGVTFTLVAADSTGSTASDNVTLVVSRNAAPTIQVPLTEQIQSFGNYSEPSSILYRPDTNFNFTFAEDTFSDPSVSELNYYAISSNDDSPLPSWISFDAGTLTFTGTTPPFSSLVEPPQTFSLRLISSDIVGFSAVWIDFSVVVGSHTLSVDEPIVALNVTTGTLFTYDGLVDTIELDGTSVYPGKMNATAENLPYWLTFDESSWNITGTAPATANSTSFSIMFTDEYLDTLNVTFDVHVLGNTSIFSSAFPTLTVEPGKHLFFDLASYLVDSSGVDATADIEPATSWLSWDASSLLLSGDVPSSATKSIIDVTFTVNAGSETGSNKARSKRAALSQSQKLTIQIDPTTSSTTSTLTSTSPATSANSSAAGTASSQGGPSHHPPNWTIIAIVLSAVVGLALILAACFYCCHKRKKKRQSRSSLDDNDGPSPTFHQQHLHATPGVTILSGVGARGSPTTEKTVTSYSAAATAFRKKNRFSHNEKETRNKLRKSSLLSADIRRPESPPRLPPVRSVTIISNTHDGDHSEVSTPASRLKDWFASVRSFRVVHMRRPNPRFSDSYMSDDSDNNSSHREIDRLGLGLGLGRSGVLSSLRTASRDSSFRSDVEVGVPTFATDHGRTSKTLSPSSDNNNNSSSEDRKLNNKGKKREATPLIPRPLGPTPDGARTRHAMDSAERNSGGGGDPFTDSPILGVTPDIILTPVTDNDAGPSTFGLRHTTSENSDLQQFQYAHPYSRSPPAPSLQRRAFSSFHPRRHGSHRHHPSLRPARSQVSFAAAPATASIHNSVSSVDSMRSRTRRFARKASSHAKGAVSLASMALGQPKRRTLAALRKNPHLSLRSSKRSIRAIFENADAPSATQGGQDGGRGHGEGDVGDIISSTPEMSSRSRRRRRRDLSAATGRGRKGGISEFLNPRIWPQPARTRSTAGEGGDSGMPWPPTPEVYGGGSGGGGGGRVRASTSSPTSGPPPASSSYSNPYRWHPVNLQQKTSHSSLSHSRLGTPRSTSSRSSLHSRNRRRRRRPSHRSSSSRQRDASKPSSSRAGGSGRLNGHSFKSFRMQQPQLPIRRRPVGAPERTTPQSTYSTMTASGGGGGGGGGFPSPLPSLPSPIREHGVVGGNSSGLGISTYEDIVSSSPFHPSRGLPSRSSWTTISGSARGGEDDTATTNNNSNSNSNNNNNSGSGSGGLDSSTGTLPNWIVYGRAADLDLSLHQYPGTTTTGQDEEEEEDGEGDDDSLFGLDARGNRLPYRESSVLRSPVDWRRFGPSSPTPAPFSPSSVEGGRGGNGEGSSSSSAAAAAGARGRGQARRSMFLGGGGFFGGGGGGGGLRIVNPGTDSINNTNTTTSSVSGSVKASTTAQSNNRGNNVLSEGGSSSRIFL